jgi:hypothetical protein
LNEQNRVAKIEEGGRGKDFKNCGENLKNGGKKESILGYPSGSRAAAQDVALYTHAAAL